VSRSTAGLSRILRRHGRHFASHQVARGQALGLADVLVVQHLGDHAGVGQRLLGQQVGLGDDADHLPVVVDPRGTR
jgi:hypothetical protein